MQLETLPKVGPKTINILNKLNINTIEDLLTYYPYRYNVIKLININDADEALTTYVKAKIISVPKVAYIKKNFNRLDFIAENNNIQFKVVIFNRAYLKKLLTVDREIIIIGKYQKLKNVFTASDIKFKIDEERIEPIYHLTEGLKNSFVESIMSSALDLKLTIPDYIPSYLNEKYHFITKDDAIKLIHKPKSIEDIKSSELKLIYEELFIYMFKINYLKSVNKVNNGIKKDFDMDIVQEFLASLTFELTTDQIKTIEEILNDLKSNKRMNRLVIGDVGSGKTIVAIIATFANFLSGYSTAFMAPTEILAKQHYETINEYFKYFDINICLLTGSLTKKKKISIYKEIENGKYDVVIGTHALLNENLKFNNLGLVITDEQHRFGVNQRNILQNKGMNKEADVLYLSATPIPRTYALTIYGDLDLSQIKTKPNIRKEIKTKVVYEQNIKEVLMAMYEELKLNHQIFVVSPLIMQNDELDLNSVIKLKEKLDIAFNKKVRIEILHGKLKQKEKDELMKEFQRGKIKILISTTVIEVGIDVPNATMMVIFNAERFGLATLHQLRGRVGRSNLQSYCYLVTNTKNNERLKVMEESSDGFYISEMDFKQRGQGDLFGIKQSGDMSFKIANLNRDYNILMQTNKDSNEFLTSNNYKENELYTNIVKDIANSD
ncbi:dNA helicase RecG [Clostridium sp. CAG:609]|nr:dNA helicase RecG [Clostridium sp. CAG:609]